MPITVIAGALAVMAAIPLLLFSLAGSGQKSLFGKRQSTLGAAPDVRRLVLETSAWERVVRPFTRSFATPLVRISPRGWGDKIERNITMAGLSGRLTLEQVTIVKVGIAAGLFLFGWLGPISDLDLGLLITVSIAAVGFLLPDIWLSRKAEQRQYRIQIELPDVLDQVSLSMQAGLGFEAAVARAARVGTGPLAAELNRTVQEIQLGVSRSDALRNLADRTDAPDMNSFVIAVVQAEEYGLAITKVLEVQADELRDKRRQRAEERALRIPVLLIFPLALCIFPTILIVLLGPALIRIYRDIQIISP